MKLTTQDRKDNQRRALSRRIIATELLPLLQNKRGIRVLETDETIKLRPWKARVETLTDVQKMVHLAMRKDIVDEEDLKTALTKQRRRAYEDEVTIQLERLGCQKTGRLSAGPALTELSELSRVDAQSIIATYNDDLAKTITGIADKNPRANRHTYAKNLKTWDTTRATEKSKQIAQFTDSSARSVALKDFYTFNDVQGFAVLAPTTAQCPVCAGWIARGEVPMQEATNNAPPYHPNCNHYFITVPAQKADKEGCAELWTGS